MAQMPVPVSYTHLDVYKRQDEFKYIDVLINNAGMAIGKATFDEIPMDDFERLINVNLWGVIYHTKLFLPTLLARPEAAIVNTSSVFGLFPVPSQVPYCVSKLSLIHI